MIWILSCLLLSNLSLSEEVKQFSEQAEKQIDEEASTFLRRLYQESPTGSSPKCKNCPNLAVGPNPSKYDLLVFMSFSVPLESWKEWAYSIEKLGGVFVLKGLPGNSFEVFSKKVRELRQAGVIAPINIDPEVFEKYGVQSVPTTVLVDGEKYDKMTGNIHLESVLKDFKEKGSTPEITKKLLLKTRLEK